MEVQDKFPPVALPLSEVGVVGVKVPLNFEDYRGRKVVVVPRFNAFIDLSAERKGIHASRQYEAITEVFSSFAGKTYKLEQVCARMAVEILKRHEGARRARVQAVGDAILEKFTPVSRRPSYEPYRLMASAVAFKENTGMRIVSKVGVGVKGVTACPCAQELIAQRVIDELCVKTGISWSAVRGIPLATHMQRSTGILVTEVPQGLSIDAFKLAEIVEESMSAPSYGLLKREDEVEIVYQAASRPLFAEDAVRLMIKRFVKTYPEMPSQTRVTFKVISEESIHKHSFMAVRVATFGELKAEVEADSSYE